MRLHIWSCQDPRHKFFSIAANTDTAVSYGLAQPLMLVFLTLLTVSGGKEISIDSGTGGAYTSIMVRRVRSFVHSFRKGPNMAEDKKRFTVADLKGAVKRTFEDLKKPVATLSASFGVFKEKAASLAPKVMGLYAKILSEAADAGISFTFVDFVRLFDPALPEKAEDYRKAKSYYTLDYLRNVQRPKRAGKQGQRDVATDESARLIATLLQVFRAEDHETLWGIIADEFRMASGDASKKERRIKLLKARVEKAQPLIDLSKRMKPIHLELAQVIHMESTKDDKVPAQATPAEAQAHLNRLNAKMGRKLKGAAAPGQRVRAVA